MHRVDGWMHNNKFRWRRTRELMLFGCACLCLLTPQALPPPPPSPPPVGMPEDDVVTCSHLLAAGLDCLKVAAFCG
jgi:hypothetical protein